jgi:heptosyltransferase-2
MHANQPYRGPLFPLIRIFDALTIRVRHGWGGGVRRPALQTLKPRRILVIESHLIGDQVLMLPLLEALTAFYPNAEIHILANPWLRDLVDPMPVRWVFHPCWIPWSCSDHRLLAWKALWGTVQSLRSLDFDLAIDVRGDLRNILLLALTRATRRIGYGNVSGGEGFLTDSLPAPPLGGHLTEPHRGVLRALGVPDSPYLPRLHPQQPEVAWAKTLLGGLGLSRERMIGIHPGASQVDRRIPAEHLRLLILGVRSAGWQPVLLGGEKEMPLLKSVCASMDDPPPILQAPLSGFLAMCGELGRLVTMDSGPAHIGAAVGSRMTVIIHEDKIRTTAPLAEEGQLTLVPYQSTGATLPITQILSAIGACPQATAG